MSFDLGKTLKSINDTKEYTYDGTYVPYVINKSLSYFIDTIFLANETNSIKIEYDKMQYDFLLYSVRKRKRFSKWEKPSKSKYEDAIVFVYKVNRKRAREIECILGKSELDYILEQYKLINS